MTSPLRLAQAQSIDKIAEKAGIPLTDLEHFGRDKAKISLKWLEHASPEGQLILVTAMSPTPQGEGKTTITLGLSQALQSMGHRAACSLRQASLGPLLGVKGGATGGGRAEILPSVGVNLHFTGDLHAIATAHNLIAALIDNHLFQKMEPELRLDSILWPRAIDMNDRALRHIICGRGGPLQGVERSSSFIITAASEIMALFALAQNYDELRERISRILLGFRQDGQPFTMRDLGSVDAVVAMLAEALKPNLVQSTEGVPVFVHAGPFANIAHGCSSLLATRMALRSGDYAVTEAGFSSELGAEKFFHIVCRAGQLQPTAVVIVVTLKAVHYHSQTTAGHDPQLQAGLDNVLQHINNVRRFGYVPVVAVNRFPQDEPAELERLLEFCATQGCAASIVTAYTEGGHGALDLAAKVIEAAQRKSQMRLLYELSDTPMEKVKRIAQELYGAQSVEWQDHALQKLESFQTLGVDKLPVCIAKTPLSLSDQPKLRGRPQGFTVTVTDCEAALGAGFLRVIMGPVQLLPGLPKEPASTRVVVHHDGSISGLV